MQVEGTPTEFSASSPERPNRASDKNHFIDKLLVVLVIYECPIQESASLTSLFKWPESNRIKILIYDNSFKPQSPPPNPNIQYVHNPLNPGVGIAYNYANQIAINQKLDWMLLLDEDTTLPENTLHLYGLAVQESPQEILFVPWIRDKTGILSPFIYRWSRGWRMGRSTISRFDMATHRVINSGMLISTEAFRKVGGYHEDIPLDFSDISFLKKLKQISTSFTVIPFELTQHFSSTEVQKLEERIQRFKFYCIGGRAMARYDGGTAWIAVHGMARAIRMGIKYQSMSFLAAFMSIWLRKK